MTGRVYLVGAGLGDPRYLTVWAEQLLSQAEVLIYDALVDDPLLNRVPADCLKINVGKRGGAPSTPQSQINQLLVDHCQQGKRVVRLKSGDPFIFGRSSSEIQALVGAGCDFEVVPGLSSALAAPLLVGIPLTDPVMSRGFMVVTAHELDPLDWDVLARVDTLVILMGAGNLPEIVDRLARKGRSLSTPVAVIRWAGTPQQQQWNGTLGTIAERTLGCSLSPAVIVVGDVVELQQYLQSPNRPLQGKTILVTRAATQSADFTTLLQAQGARVVEMPTLEIVPPSSWEALDQAIGHLLTFDWLILTSSNAVEFFFQRLTAQNKDSRALAGVKIAVVGKKTHKSLQAQGLKADYIPPDFVADALVEHFPETVAGKRILFPRVESGGREILVQELSSQGATVVEVAAYQSQCPQHIDPQIFKLLQQRSVDVMTFASSKTVQFFHQLVTQAGMLDLTGVCVASIGPQTSKTCQELLGRVDVEAKEYTLEGLTQAIVHWSRQAEPISEPKR